ncbi:MAG: hypothetical protein Q8S73_26420, partial [Deltaproteobacteria bacterium]|nr:hypothetical protein [Deltaproteobacteria bacterium]
ARRRAALGALARYIAAGRFPRNRVAPTPTPVFVDADGARCAMAALIGYTGGDALVRRIAREHNLAYVEQLRGDPELGAWLDHHGISVAEAARIQPAYGAYEEPSRWQPTVSVVASAAAGASTESGPQLALAPAVRLGVRRVSRGGDDHGNSRYGSLALTAEYARSFVIGVGGAHRVGLLLQWEPAGNSSDAQWYLLGGPLAAIDDDGEPGGAWGAQLGAGFNFRTRTVPLLFEAMLQGLGRSTGATLQVAVNAGVVW